MKRLVLIPLLLWASIAWAYSAGKILVQAQPSATTTAIYVVPTPAAGGQESSTVITGIWVTNTDSSARTFRLAVAQACAADNIKQYLFYNTALAANAVMIQSVNIPLSSTDCIRVQTDADQKVNFELFGVTNP